MGDQQSIARYGVLYISIEYCNFIQVGENLEHIEPIVQYWVETSEKDYRTMQVLLKSGDYSWALFMGYLV